MNNETRKARKNSLAEGGKLTQAGKDFARLLQVRKAPVGARPKLCRPAIKLVGNLVDRVQVAVEDGFDEKGGLIVLQHVIGRLIKLECEIISRLEHPQG